MEKGYVGCVKKEEFVCFTLNVYDSVLKAANGARSLEKKLRDTEVKSKTVKDKKIQITTKSRKKKVSYSEKLYTLADTKVMPLLSFQEVWVIIKGDEYVSDCLNNEKKKLVTLTPNKDCLLYTSPSPRDKRQSRMPSSA